MEMSASSERVFARILEQRTGQALAISRRWRFDTALKPLLRDHDINTLDRLAAMVASGREPVLADAVVEALLNNETSFFRDLAAFQMLTEKGLDDLAARRASSRHLRIWCAGCSTGQELWSLAMHFAGEADRWRGWRIDFLGTDVSRSAIGRARDGLYTQFEIQRGLPVRLMMRWFDPEGEAWRIRPALREGINFHHHNLLDPAPRGGRFDLVLCRNVLLYFDAPVRRRVFDRISDAIAPDGMLMLGAGETVIGQTDAFVADTDLRGLYRPRAAIGMGGGHSARAA